MGQLLKEALAESAAQGDSQMWKTILDIVLVVLILVFFVVGTYLSQQAGYLHDATKVIHHP